MPKREKTYQYTIKYTKWPEKNKKNPLQDLPKLGFWQLW
jgi:hypothetical protein